MRIYSKDFGDMGRMPLSCAFGTFDLGRFRFRENHNPHLAWTDVPEGTQSFALICDDLDAADVDQEAWASGKLPKDIKARVLCHWVLVDLPSMIRELDKGEMSDGAYAGGKIGPGARYGARQGSNDMTGFFVNGGLLKGEYFGYDGPCPPEGAKPHRYVFNLYALDVGTLNVEGVFEKKGALAAMEGRVLAMAALTGLF